VSDIGPNMGLSIIGSDRFLNAVVGQEVAAATRREGKLHTAFPALRTNELAGNGYTDHDLMSSDFSVETVSSYRRLKFPDMEFFNAGEDDSQSGDAFGFWLDGDLIWDDPVSAVPMLNVPLVSVESFIGVLLSHSSIVLTEEGMDRGLKALAGDAFAEEDMFWELHSGSGVPTAATRLTGGGVDGAPTAGWIFASVAGHRRASQGAITFVTALSADTDAEPTIVGLWRGRPEESGVLHAYRNITPTDMTAAGDSITFSNRRLYIEINLDGVEPATT